MTYAQRKQHMAEQGRKRAEARREDRLIKSYAVEGKFIRACAETGDTEARILYVRQTGRYRITGMRRGPKVIVTVTAAGLDRVIDLMYAAHHEAQLANPEEHGL